MGAVNGALSKEDTLFAARETAVVVRSPEEIGLISHKGRRLRIYSFAKWWSIIY